MLLSEFDFDLPKSLIAQNPPENRTDSRLLVPQNTIIDAHFYQITEFIKPGDLLVMNNTRVIPARLFGHKASGGKVEIMIERLLNDKQVLAMVKASRAPKMDSFITLENGDKAQVINKENGFYTLNFETDSLLGLLNDVGHIPLPPYIERSDKKSDLERYQTVFAEQEGAVAAPTAGLHFDDALLKKLKNQGVDHTFVTLHVGAGRFNQLRLIILLIIRCIVNILKLIKKQWTKSSKPKLMVGALLPWELRQLDPWSLPLRVAHFMLQKKRLIFLSILAMSLR